MKDILIFVLFLIQLTMVLSISSAAVSKTRYDEIYQLAVNLAKNKEFDSAIKYFNYLLQINEGDEKVRYLTAKAYYLNGEVSQSLRSCSFIKTSSYSKKCEDILRHAESNFSSQVKLYRAQNFFESKNYNQSMQTIGELIQVDSGNPHLRLLLARIYESQGDYYRAYDHYYYVKDYVSRRQRFKIENYMTQLLSSVRPLIDYIRKADPDSTEVDLDEYWQMYCLALHMDVSLLNSSGLTRATQAIDYLEQNLKEDKLSSQNRFNMMLPLINLYSLKGKPSQAYDMFQLASKEDVEMADQARLAFVGELLKLRHPTMKPSVVKTR